MRSSNLINDVIDIVRTLSLVYCWQCCSNQCLAIVCDLLSIEDQALFCSNQEVIDTSKKVWFVAYKAFF